MSKEEVLRFNVSTDMEKERINKRVEAYAKSFSDNAKKEAEKKD